MLPANIYSLNHWAQDILVNSALLIITPIPMVRDPFKSHHEKPSIASHIQTKPIFMWIYILSVLAFDPNCDLSFFWIHWGDDNFPPPLT